MQFDTIAHIGAAKCGSSALQSYLTNHPKLTDRSGNILCYGALSTKSFLRPNDITRLRGTFTNGYISSLDSIEIQRMPDSLREQVIRSLRTFSSPLILSCEGWFTGMTKPAAKRALVELLSARGTRSVQMLAYVRPPVKWINSAWWQWGAWRNPKVNFQRWLEGATQFCNWINYARAIAETREIAAFQLRPILGDVVSQFHESMNCDLPVGCQTVSNRSLPNEILGLYAQAPDLRPGPHVSAMDFIALRAIAQSNHSYAPTPWVLGREQIEMIIKKTRDSNSAILDMMSDEDRKAVLADPSWWSADAYTECEVVNPTKPPAAQPEAMLSLGADLLRMLRRAMYVVSKHNLLDELDEPLPPNWLPPAHAKEAGRAPTPPRTPSRLSL